MTEDFGARIGALVGVAVAGVREVGARHGFRHLTGTLADGRAVFIKAAVGDDGEAAGAFAAEANGLRWLGRAGAVPVPAVLGTDESTLVIELLPPGEPTPGAARDLGAALARMHAAGANGFGAPWPGYIASLPLDNTPLDNTPLGTTPRSTTPRSTTPRSTTPRPTAPRPAALPSGLGELVRGATARSLSEEGAGRRRALGGRRAPGGGRHREDPRAGRPAGAAESGPR